MVNINKIQTAMLGLVGFNQPYNPSYAIVNIDNLASESGYFATDNPYAKIEFIKDNQDYFDISNEDFNAFLVTLKKSSISNIVNQVFSSYDFLERDMLYKNASNKVDVEQLPLGFVGYRIKVSNAKNIAFKINRVLLDFDGAGDIELILWNTASKTPIYTKEATITTDHQIEVLDWTIDNSGNTYKGEYYIGYHTTGLTVHPYKRQYNNASVMTSLKNIALEKVFVANHNSATLFDVSKADGISEDLGLNLDISVYDDFTDFVINNKMLFARALQLQMTISCIQIYMASLRSNSNQSHANQIYEKIMIELEGTRADNVIYIKGIKNQLLSEISSIRAEIKKLQVGVFKSRQFLVSTQI
jgi:hypothetical protein